MDDQEVSQPTLPVAAPPPAPFDLATLKGMMERRAQAGWAWDDDAHTLTDPADRQCYFRIDPLTRCIALSDALARQLAQPAGDQPPREQP